MLRGDGDVKAYLTGVGSDDEREEEGARWQHSFSVEACSVEARGCAFRSMARVGLPVHIVVHGLHYSSQPMHLPPGDPRMARLYVKGGTWLAVGRSCSRLVQQWGRRMLIGRCMGLVGHGNAGASTARGPWTSRHAKTA